jgi:hypothetical protein
MASTTFRTFIDNIEALVVAGVVRQYTQGPPASVAADIPFQYVRYPSGSEGPAVFGESGGNPEMRAELVICVEAVAQNKQPENFDNTVAMMDNVNTAIRAAGNCWPGKSKCWWEIRMGIDTVAGFDYWAVITSIRGYGGM